MASPNLMGLVRELKGLNAKKKSGQPLTDDEKKRRKELKAYLKTALEEQQGGGGRLGETTDSSGISPSAIQPSGTGPSINSGSGAPVSSGTGPAIVSSSPVVSATGPAVAPSRPPAPAAPAAVAPAVAAPAPATAPPAAAAPAPAPVKKGNPNAFAIDASALLGEAATSDAVNATHRMERPTDRKDGAPKPSAGAARAISGGGVDLSAPLAGFEPQGKASTAQIDEMVAKSDAASRANKTRDRAKKPDEVEQQLAELQQENAFTFTSNDEAYLLDDYFGGWAEDGYGYLEDDADADIAPIDPREMELHKVGLGSSDTGGLEAGELSVAAPPGLAFADDFAELYTSGVLPKPEDEEEPDLDDPTLLIPGRRKVTVHMLNGSSKRGVIRLMRKGDLGFTLEPLGSGRSEEMSVSQIKAVFIQKSSKSEIQKSSKSEGPQMVGQMVTVTFRDRRKVQGATADYAPGAPMFTLIPYKGQFERIIVNGAAVVAVQ
jgi:hypothetical protein